MRLPSGRAETVAARVPALALSDTVRAVVQPLLDLLAYLAAPVTAADRWAAQTATAEPVARRLMTALAWAP